MFNMRTNLVLVVLGFLCFPPTPALQSSKALESLDWDRHYWHRHRRWRRPCTTTTTTAGVPQIPDDLVLVNGQTHSGQCNWGGMNSYFLYAMEEKQQNDALRDMQQYGLKVLRIFVSTVPANFKGTKSQFVNFLEPEHMGPPYDTQVLELINDFMVKVQSYGVKLVIALHDRYSLGCWSCDGYQKELNLTCAPKEGKKCKAEVNDASEFYENATAISFYDQRLQFILNYTNPHFDNRPWGELKEVVAMYEVQNEAQGYDPVPWVTDWHCDRAKVMKPLMDPAIFVGTGGGRTFQESSLTEHFTCPEIDVVTVHDYDASSWDEIWYNVTQLRQLSLTHDKKVLYEEFGNKKRYYRPDYHYAVITACNLNGIPFMPWEYVHPPNTDDTGQEFDIHQATYPVLVYGVLVANKTGSVQRWSNLELCNVS